MRFIRPWKILEQTARWALPSILSPLTLERPQPQPRIQPILAHDDGESLSTSLVVVFANVQDIERTHHFYSRAKLHPYLQSDAASLKDQGNKAFAAKEYSQAIDLFTQAIALDPTNHVLYSNRSAAKAGLKDWTGALEDADQVRFLSLHHTSFL